jgi:hypothetical protein
MAYIPTTTKNVAERANNARAKSLERITPAMAGAVFPTSGAFHKQGETEFYVEVFSAVV